jgi:hypothetical protein
MGGLPQLFHRDRTKANNFIDEVKAYLRLNADVVGFDSPYKKVAFTLTLIKGEEAVQWVRDIGNWLDNLVLPQDNIPALWDQFLMEFQQQFQDTQAPQRARNELMECRMQGNKFDEYVAKFEGLARKAGYMQGNEETYNMFLRGLPETLLRDILKPPVLQNYQDLKDRGKQLSQGQAVIEGILKRGQGGSNAFQRVNQQPWQPFFSQNNQGNWCSNQGRQPSFNLSNVPPSMNNTPVPMDLGRNCAPNNWRGRGNWRLQRGGQLTQGRVVNTNNNACFNCGQVGHFVYNCP